MRRYYSIPINAVAVAAAQDLFEIVASNPFRLVELVVGQSSDYGDAQAEGVNLTISRATPGFTPGTSGSAATPAPHRSGSPASTASAKINNTGRAVAGSGSLTVLRTVPFNVQHGFSYSRPDPPERSGDDERSAYLFAAGEACLISLPNAPADSITLSATAVIEEVF